MIFVDYLGPTSRLGEVSEVVRREVAAALRLPPAQVAIRRLLTEDDRDEVELWVELSTDEQLYRLRQGLPLRLRRHHARAGCAGIPARTADDGERLEVEVRAGAKRAMTDQRDVTPRGFDRDIRGILELHRAVRSRRREFHRAGKG